MTALALAPAMVSLNSQFSAGYKNPDVALKQVVIDRRATVVGIADQILPLVLRVGDRLAGQAFGQDLRGVLVEPFPERGQHRHAVLLAQPPREVLACFTFRQHLTGHFLTANVIVLTTHCQWSQKAGIVV